MNKKIISKTELFTFLNIKVATNINSLAIEKNNLFSCEARKMCGEIDNLKFTCSLLEVSYKITMPADPYMARAHICNCKFSKIFALTDLNGFGYCQNDQWWWKIQAKDFTDGIYNKK